MEAKLSKIQHSESILSIDSILIFAMEPKINAAWLLFECSLRKGKWRSVGCFKRKLGKSTAEDVQNACPIRRLCDAGRRVAPSDDFSGEAFVPCSTQNHKSLIIDLRLQGEVIDSYD